MVCWSLSLTLWSKLPLQFFMDFTDTWFAYSATSAVDVPSIFFISSSFLSLHVGLCTLRQIRALIIKPYNIYP